MWGTSSWGVARWAAVDGSYLAIDTYSPVTVRVVYEGGAAPSVSGINAIRSYQIVRETLRNSSANIQVMQIVRETLRSTNEANTVIIVRAIVRETLRSNVTTGTKIVVRAMVRETLRSSGLVADIGRRRQLLLPNVGPML